MEVLIVWAQSHDMALDSRGCTRFAMAALEPSFLRAMLADVPPASPQAAQVRAFNSGLTAAE